MKSTDQQDLVWLTAQEAAQYLKVKTRTLLLWVRQGKIKGHILSGSVRHVMAFPTGRSRCYSGVAIRAP